MKKLFTGIIFIICTLYNVAHAEPGTNDAEIFDLPITTLSGDTFTLGDYRNHQSVYLKFWATWCQPCREEMPHLQHAFEKYGDGIKFVAVNIGINEDMETIKATLSEFGLTLPVAIDSSGRLSKAFNMIGTPYHVLIDKTGHVVHRGHKASKELDSKLALLSDHQGTDLPDALPQQTATRSLDLDRRTGEVSALFFLSTWCDWYLKDTRPGMSENCTNAQKLVNTLYNDIPHLNWQGIASRLWTGNKELDAYKAKYHIAHPLAIDTSGDIFLEHDVKNLPTLILKNNGREIFRETDFSDPVTLTNTIKQVFKKNTDKETRNFPPFINVVKR